MRLLTLSSGDLKYQFKYGFFFLYCIVSAVYIGILFLIPVPFKREAAALIILTDPALLGVLFIGGILLLERGEGLHHYLTILPVKDWEFITAKILSLSLISTLAGLLIAGVGLGWQLNAGILIPSLLVGAGVFTLLGFSIGAMARSVNHYLVLSMPLGTLLTTPAVLAVFGLTHPILEPLPGLLLLRLLYASLGLPTPYHPIWAFVGLLFWLVPGVFWGKRQFQVYVRGG